jgi:hypothetical protein
MHDAVTCVIPGAKTPARRAKRSAADLPPLDAATMAARGSTNAELGNA